MCRVLPPESEAGECNWSLVREDFEAWTDPTGEVALPCQEYKDYEDIPPLNMEVWKKNHLKIIVIQLQNHLLNK